MVMEKECFPGPSSPALSRYLLAKQWVMRIARREDSSSAQDAAAGRFGKSQKAASLRVGR